MSANRVAAILGAGPGTGAALARAFAAKGYSVAILARSAQTLEPLAADIKQKGGVVESIICDATDEKSVTAAFEQIAKLGPLHVAVLNASSGFKRSSFLDLTLEDFERGFKVETRGAFLFSTAAIKAMLAHKNGTSSLIFTDGNANRRDCGSARRCSLLGLCSGQGASALTPDCSELAQFALRGLSQSLAREFGPKGIHVAMVQIDGLIDTPRIRGLVGEPKNPDDWLQPDAIAASYVHLTEQPPSAWTQEIDIRPAAEKW